MSFSLVTTESEMRTTLSGSLNKGFSSNSEVTKYGDRYLKKTVGYSRNVVTIETNMGMVVRIAIGVVESVRVSTIGK